MKYLKISITSWNFKWKVKVKQKYWHVFACCQSVFRILSRKVYKLLQTNSLLSGMRLILRIFHVIYFFELFFMTLCKIDQSYNAWSYLNPFVSSPSQDRFQKQFSNCLTLSSKIGQTEIQHTDFHLQCCILEKLKGHAPLTTLLSTSFTRILITEI